jgi:hypothetical protein
MSADICYPTFCQPVFVSDQICQIPAAIRFKSFSKQNIIIIIIRKKMFALETL